MADGHCVDKTDLEHSVLTESSAGQHESRTDLFINSGNRDVSIIIFKV